MKKLFFAFGFTFLMSLSGFAQKLVAKTELVQIQTSAICEMCKKRIERDLGLTKGVEKAQLNLKNKVVTVAYNPEKTDKEQIKKAISNIGYDADNVVADTKAHDKLPECCQKTAKGH